MNRSGWRVATVTVENYAATLDVEIRTRTTVRTIRRDCGDDP